MSKQCGKKGGSEEFDALLPRDEQESTLRHRTAPKKAGLFQSKKSNNIKNTPIRRASRRQQPSSSLEVEKRMEKLSSTCRFLNKALNKSNQENVPVNLVSSNR